MSDALHAGDLVGTWRLTAWTSDGDGGVTHPMGDAPEGILVYTSGGTMITTIGRAGRQPIDGGDLLSGPVDQRMEAMETFIAYSGTYRVDGGDVVHDVSMSLFPNWIGTTQRRHVTLDETGDELVLSADPMVVRGRFSANRLTWRRVADESAEERS